MKHLPLACLAILVCAAAACASGEAGMGDMGPLPMPAVHDGCVPGCPLCAGSGQELGSGAISPVLAPGQWRMSLMAAPDTSAGMLTRARAGVLPGVDVGIGWSDANGKVLADGRACLCRQKGARPAVVVGMGTVVSESVEPTVYATASRSGLLAGEFRFSLQGGFARRWRGGAIQPLAGLSLSAGPHWSLMVQHDGRYLYPSLWHQGPTFSIGVLEIRERPGIAISLRPR